MLQIILVLDNTEINMIEIEKKYLFDKFQTIGNPCLYY